MNKLVYLSLSILEIAKIVIHVFYRQFHCTNKNKRYLQRLCKDIDERFDT